jgi:predicted ATP-grasp superfamily ATP-dependent carboligase
MEKTLKRVEALVLGGESRVALATVRSLGRRGIPVAVAGNSHSTLAGASRHAKRKLLLPDPVLDPVALEGALREEALRHPGTVWIPATDEILAVVDGIRNQVPGVHLPFPSSSVLELAWDKGKLTEFASLCGLFVPRTQRPRHAREAGEEAQMLGFPVILKPCRSKVRTKNGFRRGIVRLIQDRKEVITAWERENANIPFPLLQERIPGHGEGVFILADQGRVVTRFAHRRVREKHSSGVSVVRESIPVPEILKEPVDRLIQALGWHGVCMIEFRIDARDGKPYLMAVNPRLWGSLQLAVDAGMDFPFLLYQLALEEKIAVIEPYRVGVRSRWLLGDLDHLVGLLRNTSGPGHLSSSLSSSSLKPMAKFRAILKFLHPFAGRQEIFRWDDIKPAFHEWAKYIGKLMGKS